MTIRVLIAEDTATTRELLVAILGSDPGISIVGTASDGAEAVEMTLRLRPDVVTMDIHMPKLDGFEATRLIMSEAPTPIVIVSGNVDVRDVQVSMDALRAGAVSVLPRPASPASATFETSSAQFINTVKAMAGVKVIRHWGARPAAAIRRPLPEIEPPKIIAIAASTGGPAALEHVLSKLPAGNIPPVLVVQHIAPGFTEGLATWLNSSSKLEVCVAEHRQRLVPDRVYLAPEGKHLGVVKGGRIMLSSEPPVGGFRPSATFLFRSVAEHFGSSAVAVVLTGMGRDGADGLSSIRDAGGLVIAQDEATSVVFGMPAAAIEAGVTDLVLPLEGMAPHLIQLINRKDAAHAENSGR